MRTLMACLLLAVAAPAQQPAGAKYALLVGIDKYDPKELTSLRYPVNDVTDLAAALKTCGYRAEDVVLMTPRRGAEVDFRFTPTAEHVLEQLTLLLSSCRPQDSVLVAFAGHGVQFKGESEVFFCPNGAKLADRKTLVSLSQVYKQLEGCKAGVKLLLSDACRDDPLAASSRSSATMQVEKGVAKTTTPPRGVVAMFSCDVGQQAFESERVKRGVFFHHVIEGLSGKADRDRDGRVTLNELDDFVAEEVDRFVRSEFGVKQTPNRFGNATGVLPLAIVNVAPPAAPAVAKVVPPPPPSQPQPQPQPQAPAQPRTSPKSGSPTVFVGEKPGTPPTTTPSKSTKPAKPAELQPLDTRNGYKIYLEPNGDLTCFQPVSLRGQDRAYWTFKKPGDAIAKAVYGPDIQKMRVAVAYGKKLVVLDGRLGTPLPGFPRDLPGVGSVSSLSFEPGGKVVIVGGQSTLRFDAESGDPLTINGTRVIR